MISSKKSMLGLSRVNLGRSVSASRTRLSLQAGSLLSSQHHLSRNIDRSNNGNHPGTNQRCSLSTAWGGRGHDMLGEALSAGGNRPKVLLEAMGPSGFDVSNLLKKIDPNEVAPHGAMHMMGSVLVFPTSCFLWKVETSADITMESLAPVILFRPKIEFLFLGTAKSMDQIQLKKLQADMKQKCGIVVEWLPLSEAMATFNILNGEDRMVATALVLDQDESHYVTDHDAEK